jgi:hypothetical protein
MIWRSDRCFRRILKALALKNGVYPGSTFDAHKLVSIFSPRPRERQGLGLMLWRSYGGM